MRRGKTRITTGCIFIMLQILSAIGNAKSGHGYSAGFDNPALFMYDLIFYISSHILGIVGIILLCSGMIAYFKSRKEDLEDSAPAIPLQDSHPSEQTVPATRNATITSPRQVRFPILPVLVFSLAVILLLTNIFQFTSNRSTVSELNATIQELETKQADLESEISKQDDTISTQNQKIKKMLASTNSQAEEIKSLKSQIHLYNETLHALLMSDSVHGSKNFYTDANIVFLDVNGGSYQFTLTARNGSDWVYKSNISVSYSSPQTAKLSFDNLHWRTSTTVTVEPLSVGATVVTLKNKTDSSVIKILVIVTE